MIIDWRIYATLVVVWFVWWCLTGLALPSSDKPDFRRQKARFDWMMRTGMIFLAAVTVAFALDIIWFGMG